MGNLNGTAKRAQLVDMPTVQRADIFLVALIDAAGNTLVPEIREIFGESATLKFLQIFEGRTIKVPRYEVIRKAVRDVGLYVDVHATRKSDFTAIGRIAQKYGCTVDAARSTYMRIRALVRQLES